LPHRAPIARPNVYQHQDRDRHRRKRESGLGRHYDSPQWRNRTRPYILGRDPFCKIGIICDGDGCSTDVDHVIPAEIYVEQHSGDETFFYDGRNLRGACHACHSRKTVLEQRGQWREPKSEVGKGGLFSNGAARTTAPHSRT
jgi:5-methylcytosine-specific restriction protein A